MFSLTPFRYHVLDSWMKTKKKYKGERLLPHSPAFWKYFFENVDSSGPCWLWTGVKTNAGYGVISIQNEHHYAHRLMYEYSVEKVEKGIEICHRCDTPACCNPQHLFAGTHSDNMKDAARKGRMIGRRKLTPEQVVQIKKQLKAGYTQKSIGDSFGVSRSAILTINLGKNWGWIKV